MRTSSTTTTDSKNLTDDDVAPTTGGTSSTAAASYSKGRRDSKTQGEARRARLLLRRQRQGRRRRRNDDSSHQDTTTGGTLTSHRANSDEQRDSSMRGKAKGEALLAAVSQTSIPPLTSRPVKTMTKANAERETWEDLSRKTNRDESSEIAVGKMKSLNIKIMKLLKMLLLEARRCDYSDILGDFSDFLGDFSDFYDQLCTSYENIGPIVSGTCNLYIICATNRRKNVQVVFG